MSSSTHPLSPATSFEYTQATDRTRTSARTGSIPWYVWLGVAAITSATIGGTWDVSWHRSIGRDTFWTPAHVAIYACGVLAGVICSYLILVTTFNKSAPLRPASVNVLGFRAPLGAFIAAWGGIAMLTSAPFDNWWHNAYGLDVKIVSPPHTLLILGTRAVTVGVLFLILAAMNRASEAGRTDFKSLQRLFLYAGGILVTGQMFFLLEPTRNISLHSVLAYFAMSIAVPLVLAVISQASRYRWAATAITSMYMLFAIAEILIFPLFPASPKLGPVYFPVTHMVPTKFPVLLFVPALALDLLWQRTSSWKFWKVAIVSGVLFVAVLFAVEWPFANFLLSKASENRFFGTMYFSYATPADSFNRMRRFADPDHGMTLYFGLLRSAVVGAIGTWIGLSFGRWMRSVQR
ncbi:hypothetical protein [Granulicella sp. dw_53]|uniref:hypothetical protein n=1 Tax=Granulicella sp. dw_53 TaxID=2719792 RepID=UPI001BD684CC|nr:hypothetical protein [Granulicella sp. dw_53]